MAEYYISYEELEKLIDQYIEDSVDNVQLTEHKAEILAALTGDYEQNNWDSAKEMISLWENQINEPSQLLLGSRYIRVQQSMLEFLKIFCTSGLVVSLIACIPQHNFVGITFSVESGIAIVIALWELFAAVKKLDDWDFCIYMQAATHFREHSEFTMEELKSWLPNEENPVCNMHNNKWECDYLEENDSCNIICEDKIKQALKSLYDKGLLGLRKENHKYFYKFKK